MIWKLDRLGRDLRHLVITAEDLRSRGIGLKVLTGAGAQIDTTTANGRLAFGIFAAFAEFAREPERRIVGLDARVSVAGVTYELDPELAGETAVLWWGLFDAELFAEFGDERYGPFDPVGGPVPLHRYRKHRKTRRDVRQDRVAELATRISIPRSALSGEPDLVARAPHRTAPWSRHGRSMAPIGSRSWRSRRR